MLKHHKPCVMYVDYESLAAHFTQTPYVDIDAIVIGLLEKAHQQFDVQGAVVLGDWRRLSSKRRLEMHGFICRSTHLTDLEGHHLIRHGITERLATHRADEVYLLVGGQPEYTAILRQLQRSGKDSILWTVVQPSANDRELCSAWEQINMPSGISISSWPRQVMLHAVVLAAIHLQQTIGDRFQIGDLLDNLRRMDSFGSSAEIWLTVAIRERVLLLQDSNDPLDPPYGWVNTYHAVTQKALLIRDRILNTLSTMLQHREWIAFNTAERGLRSVKQLAESQHIRHAWLELLVALDMLVSRRIPRPDGKFVTTTLHINTNHSVVAMHRTEHYLQLVRLILKMSNFLERRGYSWIAASTLLKMLTGTSSRAEARATLTIAQEQAIVQIDSLLSPYNPPLTVTIVRLNQNHQLVNETLARRDQLIALANTVLAWRRFGVSEMVLVDEFTASGALSEDDALFWIWLFVSEDLFHSTHFTQGTHDSIRMLQLNITDSVVSAALEQTGKELREVQP
jgi:hypothetical protein